MRRRLLLTLSLILGVVRVTTAQTTAQPIPERPYRGLFGGAQPLSSRAPSLSLSLAGFGGWDEPTSVSSTTAPDDRVNISGPFSGTTAGLDFTNFGERLNSFVSAYGFAGYFPDNKDDPWYTSSSAAGHIYYRAPLSPRNQIRFGESALFSTDVRLGLVGTTPGSGVPPATGNSGFDNSLQRDPYLNSLSDVVYSHSFSRASSVDATYGYGFYHFFNNDTERSDYREQRGGFNYNHAIGRYATLVLGYMYRYNRIPDSTEPPLTAHDVNVGVNYSRALSLTRTTQLSFHTGSTVTSSTNTNSPTPDTTTRFLVTGGAELTREIGQSWVAQARYSRDVKYDYGFSQPILYDAAGAWIGGLIGRNLDVSSGVSYIQGAIGLETTNYHSLYAVSQIRWAISHNLAAYASYYYYGYNFASDVTLPVGVVQELDRNGVRVGFNTWLPLWTGRGAP